MYYLPLRVDSVLPSCSYFSFPIQFNHCFVTSGAELRGKFIRHEYLTIFIFYSSTLTSFLIALVDFGSRWKPILPLGVWFFSLSVFHKKFWIGKRYKRAPIFLYLLISFGKYLHFFSSYGGEEVWESLSTYEYFIPEGRFRTRTRYYTFSIFSLRFYTIISIAL